MSSPPVDEFDDPTQSGELYSDDAVQSTSQTKYENADAIHQNRFKIRKKLVERDDDDESESDSDESENDDVNKEKVSEPYNPYIEYYLNQALTGQTYF